MPWEPTKYGAIVSLDMSQNEIVSNVEYIRLNKSFAPETIGESLVPEKIRFEYLNKQLTKDDNTEEYNAEITSCYKQYRKANHMDILQKMLSHPKMIKDTIFDFIKRRL